MEKSIYGSNYYSKDRLKNQDCSAGNCYHFDCINKLGKDICLLINKKPHNKKQTNKTAKEA